MEDDSTKWLTITFVTIYICTVIALLRTPKYEDINDFIDDNYNQIIEATEYLDYIPMDCAEDYGFISYDNLVDELYENEEYEALEVIEDLYGYME